MPATKKAASKSGGRKPGLYANIQAKRERIAHGSGEHMRKPGSDGAPAADAFEKAARKTAAGKTAVKKAAAKKVATKKATTKKAATKKAAARKSAGARRSTARKSASARKTTNAA